MAKSPIRVAVDAVLAQYDVYVGKNPTITDTSRDPEGAVVSTRVKYPRVKVLTTEVAIKAIRAMAASPELRKFKHIYVAMSSPKHGDCFGLVCGATNNESIVRRVCSVGPAFVNGKDSVGGDLIRNQDATAVAYMDHQMESKGVPANKAHTFRKMPDFFVHPLAADWLRDVNSPVEMRTNVAVEAKKKQWEEGRAQREAEALQHEKERKLGIALGELKSKMEADLKQYKALVQLTEITKSLPLEGSKVRTAISDEMFALDLKWQSVGVYLNTL